MGAPAAVALAGAGAFALLHFRDPHAGGSYGICPFLAVTGQPCPGCGGLRAVNDLSRGDVVAALSSNALAVALVAVLAAAWVLWVGRRLRGIDDRMIVVNSAVGAGVLVLFVAFGLFRVTPWGAWLAP